MLPQQRRCRILRHFPGREPDGIGHRRQRLVVWMAQGPDEVTLGHVGVGKHFADITDRAAGHAGLFQSAEPVVG